MNDDFHEVAQRELDAADRARRDEPSPIEERLNAELAAAYLRIGVLSARVDALDAVLPRCPTCGGKGYHVHCNGCDATWADRDDDYSCSCVCAIGDRNHEAWVQCPCPAKCVDGKVSIEQLVATYNEIERLWAEGNRDATVYHLRSVKP